MSDVEELSSKIIESCKSLEQAENELVMLASNYDPNLDEKALEQLEKEEMEKLEYIHQQRKQLFTQFQEARRRGALSPLQGDPNLGTTTSMQMLTNIFGRMSMNENVDKELEQWEIKPEEIKIDFNDPKSKLGSGTFGEVYRGRCRGVDVAVKILTKGVTQQQLEEFKHEVSILLKLRHENILMFMGVCTQGDRPQIVTELMPGGSVYSALRNPEKKLTFKQKMLIARDTALGMYWLHKEKILHLDLKPGNLLLSANGTVKIGDFGLSQRLGEIKNIGGTLNYMAPEVFDGNVSEKTDVYAFGMILWELCTEKSPWEEELDFMTKVKQQGLRPKMPEDIPDRLKTLIRLCWAQDPDERPTFEQIVENDLFSRIIIEHLISDPEGREFWKKTYGGQFEIPWIRFLTDFTSYLKVRVPPNFENDEKFFALKFVFGIDDKNQTVTIEKFADVLAYYGPLAPGPTLFDVIFQINITTGFFGELSDRDVAERILVEEKEPCFLIRLSKQKYRFSVKLKNGVFEHYEIDRKLLKPSSLTLRTSVSFPFVFVTQGKEYKTLEELIKDLEKKTRFKVCKRKSPFMEALDHFRKVVVTGKSKGGYGSSNFDSYALRKKK